MNYQYRYYSYVAYGILYLNFMYLSPNYRSFFIFEFLYYGRALYRLIDNQMKDSLEEF
jgi:hypothetical protein